MNNNTRRIVVLNNLKSRCIEQAIFILRDDSSPSEADAISEAERIVDAYLTENSQTLPDKKEKSRKKQKRLFFLGGAVALISLLLFFITH